MHRREAYQWAKDRVKIGMFTDRGHDIGGVIHVGANDGYEIQFYLAMGIPRIMAFEPLSSAYQLLRDDYRFCGVDCLNIALGNHNGFEDFYVTEGDGMGSSFFKPLPEANYSNLKHERVRVVRFHDFVRDSKRVLTIKGKLLYNTLVVDVQGYELEVLKGFDGHLDNFEFLNIECSRVPIYEGEPTAEEVITYLANFDYVPITPIEDHNDILFMKADLINGSQYATDG